MVISSKYNNRRFHYFSYVLVVKFNLQVSVATTTAKEEAIFWGASSYTFAGEVRQSSLDYLTHAAAVLTTSTASVRTSTSSVREATSSCQCAEAPVRLSSPSVRETAASCQCTVASVRLSLSSVRESTSSCQYAEASVRLSSSSVREATDYCQCAEARLKIYKANKCFVFKNECSDRSNILIQSMSNFKSNVK